MYEKTYNLLTALIFNKKNCVHTIYNMPMVLWIACIGGRWYCGRHHYECMTHDRILVYI